MFTISKPVGWHQPISVEVPANYERTGAEIKKEITDQVKALLRHKAIKCSFTASVEMKDFPVCVHHDFQVAFAIDGKTDVIMLEPLFGRDLSARVMLTPDGFDFSQILPKLNPKSVLLFLDYKTTLEHALKLFEATGKCTRLKHVSIMISVGSGDALKCDDFVIALSRVTHLKELNFICLRFSGKNFLDYVVECADGLALDLKS